MTLPGLGPAEGDGEPNGELPPGYAGDTAPGTDPLSALEKQLARLENVIAGQTERIERQQDLITRLGVAGPDASVEIEPQPRWPEIGSFDPNTASAGDLRRIGLSKTR